MEIEVIKFFNKINICLKYQIFIFLMACPTIENIFIVYRIDNLYLIISDISCKSNVCYAESVFSEIIRYDEPTRVIIINWSFAVRYSL